jgi:hypothetical protein
MKWVLIGAIVCLAASTARAQDVPTDRQPTIRGSLAALQAGGAVGKPPGFAEWSTKLDAAKARRNSGRKLFWTGIVGGSALSIVAIALASKTSEGAQNASNFFITAGLLGGGGVATYGAIRGHRALSDIEDLDREGRTKGYLAGQLPPLAPSQLALTIRF